jgi:hypothetical protein
MNSSLSLAKPMKSRKTVRISSRTQEKELSPEAKEFNRQNNFSKKERMYSLGTIHTDPEFKEYLAERRKGIPVKEYRSKILKTLKNRDKLLSEIRKLKTRKSKSPSPLKNKEDKNIVPNSKKSTKKRIQPQLLSIAPTTHSAKENKNENPSDYKNMFSIKSLLQAFQKQNKTFKKKSQK